jgi:hypothetical protein
MYVDKWFILTLRVWARARVSLWDILNVSSATLGFQLFPRFVLYFNTNSWLHSTSWINSINTVTNESYKILIWSLIYRRFLRFSKKTRGFVISVRPPVCQHEKKNQFPLDGFSWNIRWFFKTISRKFKFYYNPTRRTNTIWKELCKFIIVPLRILLRMGNI